MIDYEPHATYVCRLRQMKQTVHVDMVRVVYHDTYVAANSRCDCFEIFASRKVLQPASLFLLNFRRHDVMTLIVKLGFSPLWHTTRRIKTEKQLVLIFDSDPPNPLLPMPNRQASWSHNQDRLLNFCLESNCPRDIILVNIEHTVAGLDKRHETENMSQCN